MWSTILNVVKNALGWIARNFKLVLILAGLVVLLVLAFGWYSKNKAIRKLQYELFLAKAKLQLENLVGKYQATVKELEDLRKQDKVLDSQVSQIENDLKNKLKDDMTAEEIAKKFREIGINY